jgi:hypothetical protein
MKNTGNGMKLIVMMALEMAKKASRRRNATKKQAEFARAHEILHDARLVILLEPKTNATCLPLLPEITRVMKAAA